MIAVSVCMKVTKEPLKRTPVVLRLDLDGSETAPVLTDRTGIARFELPAGTGRVLVSGVERYHGRLDGEILVDLWSLTQSGNDSAGMPAKVTWSIPATGPKGLPALRRSRKVLCSTSSIGKSFVFCAATMPGRVRK
jgi:hypothetical protein